MSLRVAGQFSDILIKVVLDVLCVCSCSFPTSWTKRSLGFEHACILYQDVNGFLVINIHSALTGLLLQIKG